MKCYTITKLFVTAHKYGISENICSRTFLLSCWFSDEASVMAIFLTICLWIKYFFWYCFTFIYLLKLCHWLFFIAVFHCYFIFFSPSILPDRWHELSRLCYNYTFALLNVSVHRIYLCKAALWIETAIFWFVFLVFNFLACHGEVFSLLICLHFNLKICVSFW